MNSCFEKFKNALRTLKADSKVEETIFKERYFAIKEIERLGLARKVKSAKLISLNELLEPIGITMPVDINFEEFAETIEGKYAASTLVVTYVSRLISAFDNEKCIGKVERIPWFFAFLQATIITGDLTVNDACKVFGSAIYFNATHTKKQNPLLAEVAKFFNPDGSFNQNDKLDNFYEKCMAFLESFDDYDVIPDFIFDDFFNISKTVSQFSTLHDEFLRNNYKAKKVEQTSSLSMLEHKYFEIVSKYYKGSTLIGIPEDLDEFVDALNHLHFTDNQIRMILKQIEEEKEKNKYAGLFSSEEALLLQKASNLLSKMLDYEDGYYELLTALSDITTIKEMYLSGEDLTEVIGLKQDTLQIVFDLVQRIEGKSIKTTNNLVFLTDRNNSVYFTSDIENDLDGLNRAFRDQAIRLLGKIKPENARNFLPVKNDCAKSSYFFEVSNKNIHIIFRIIGNGIYLVLGVAPAKKDYKRITKRASDPKNIEYIEYITELLKDEREKDKILLKEEQVIIDLSNKEARTRKKPLDN